MGDERDEGEMMKIFINGKYEISIKHFVFRARVAAQFVMLHKCDLT